MPKIHSKGKRRTERPKWTVMVFMVGDPELQASIDRDLLEIRRAGSSEDVNVVVAVQKSGRSHTEWLEIQPCPEDATPPQGKSVGRSTSGSLDDRLDEFLKFVATKYKSDHYLAVFWGHATGLEFGRLGPGSQQDLIRIGKLAESVRQFTKHRAEPERLEILGFCACALSKAEFAIELREEVDYLISSQVGISTLMTWPFDRVIQRVLMSPDVEAETLACQIVQTFEESYEPPPVSLTALNLQQSETMGRQIEEMSNVILDALNESGIIGELNNLCVLSAFQNAIDAYPYELEPLVDFFDFCGRLVDEDALAEPVRDQARRVLNRGNRSFVTSHARSGPKFGALNGFSILAPDFDDPDWPEVFKNCAPGSSAWLWNNTAWAEMARQVYDFARSRSELTADTVEV